jgi:predicted lipoprotein with Yx(FWY)xxD motif
MTAVAAGALVLAGCGGGTSGGSTASGGGTSSGSGMSSGSGTSSSGGAASSGAELATAQTPLGTVVVDKSGRTVYAFDQDTPGSGKSSCTGTCASLWPAVTTSSSSPSMGSLTGTVATIPAAGGKQQLTLDGHPLYTYSGDSKAGQVNGEGIMGIWWAVSPSGQKVKNASSSNSSSSSNSAPGYTY